MKENKENMRKGIFGNMKNNILCCYCTELSCTCSSITDTNKTFTFVIFCMLWCATGGKYILLPSLTQTTYFDVLDGECVSTYYNS